jgi:hypothetical protein
MPRHSPYLINLSDDERSVLESVARSYTPLLGYANRVSASPDVLARSSSYSAGAAIADVGIQSAGRAGGMSG